MSVLHVNVQDVEAEEVLGGKVKMIFTPDTIGESSPSQLFAYGIFDPGEGLNPHLHPESSEIYFVVKGKGTVYHGDKLEEMPIESSDTLFIPSKTKHCVRNTGDKRLEIAFFIIPGKESHKEL